MTYNPKGLVQIIREQYPEPATFSDRRLSENCKAMAQRDPCPYYCVGGAFMFFSQGVTAFPGNGQLAENLMQYNTNLPRNMALQYAEKVIRANDKGNFQTAWNWLGKALAYTGGPIK